VEKQDMPNKPIYAMVLTVVGIMAVCLMVTKPSADHAFATKGCVVGLMVEPGDVTISAGETSIQKISGSLNCLGGNPGGAIIEFPPGSVGPNKETTLTDSSGHYHYDMVAHAAKRYIIHVLYAGDSEHSGASAMTTLTIHER
jgi:hypothetical protein